MRCYNIALTTTFLLCLLTQCWSCGPGRGSGRGRGPRKLTPLKFKQHVPNVSENTLGASGLSEQRISREDPEFQNLQTVYNGDIIFKDEEGTGADRLMTQRCKDKLNSLAILVMNQWPGVKLRVTEGWDEDGHHAENSLHYEGRAVDITTSDRLREKYGMLAELAVEAGFDWVYFESKAHIHCSVKAEHSLAAKSGGCFPGDATVTLESGMTKTVDQLNLGEKVMSVNEDGQITYSEVIMMMDSKPHTRQRYHVIETEDGHRLTLSPGHLVYASRSNVTFDPGSMIPVYSAEVELGHYLYTSHDRGRYSSIKPSRVISISSVEDKGVYAPLTREGTIIINDIVTSCYAMVNHNIAHWALGPIRLLHDFSINLWSVVASSSSEGVHWYPYVLYAIAGPFLDKNLVHPDGIVV